MKTLQQAKETQPATFAERSSQLLESYGKQILLSFLGLALLAIASIYLFFAESSKDKVDYLAAANAYALLERSAQISPVDKALIAQTAAKLEALLLRHPSLQPRYDLPLAQLLVALQIGDSTPILQRSWQRLAKSDVESLISFGKVTSLLAYSSPQAALEESEKLSDDLSQRTNSPLLSDYSQIRQALLIAQEEPSNLSTKQAWQKLSELFSSSSIQSNRPLQELQALLSDGEVSLNDYIERQIQTAK